MQNFLQKIVLIFFLAFVLQPYKADAQGADSLLHNLYDARNDSSKIEILFKVSKYYHDKERNYDLSEKYLLEALSIAEKSPSKRIKISTYNSIGVYYRQNSRYAEALKFHAEALTYSKEIHDSSLIAKSYNNIGVVYRRVDNYALAAQQHIEALRISELCNDEFNISVACNSLGNIFSINGRYDEAIVYFNKALDFSTKSNNKLGMAMNYNNIGEVYEFKHDYNLARDLYVKSLNINKEIGSDIGISISYNSLGKIALYMNNPRLAYNYFKAALDLNKKVGSKHYSADSYVNLAKATIMLEKYPEARRYIDISLKLAQEINSLLHFQTSYENLSNYYIHQNKYDLGYKYIVLSNAYKDSILNEKSAQTISAMQALYESEKRESEIKILKQEQKISDSEYNKQLTNNYILVGGICVLIFIIVGIYIMFHNKRKGNMILSQQIEEIERKNQKLAEQKEEISSQKEDIIKQKELIENKNENLESAYQTIENYVLNITESIRYAEKIQESIQPDIDFVKQKFADTVIFNKPKDIVSGDFYWMYKTPDKTFFALSDCTGHGVPGAFMSIIGIDLLNQAVRQHGYTETSEILSFLNAQLIRRLRKSDNDLILMDSMDVAICVLNNKTMELSFSGTLIPAIIVRNNQIIEIKPNAYSLGSIFRKSPIGFKTETMQMQPGDWIYISSDGYYDQIGGTDKRKYQRVHFKEFVSKISDFDGYLQREKLESEFSNWMGNNDQIDDVLVWGLKL